MQIRFTNSLAETKQMNTEQLRDNYLIENLFTDDTLIFFIRIMTG
jgi:5-keto 4-deoxyuronate isomerase